MLTVRNFRSRPISITHYAEKAVAKRTFGVAVDLHGRASRPMRERGTKAMSQAASQAWVFYRDVARLRAVWTVRDADGYLAPILSGGRRAQPFWSSRSRFERIIETVTAYASFSPEEISWETFCSVCVPGLPRDGLLVGVNWSGKRAIGYDMEPLELQRNVANVIANPQ